MKLLVLYEELASYFETCITAFSVRNNAEIHIIHKKVNAEAPFQLSLGGINTYDRSGYTDDELISLVKKIAPDAIFCGGWASKIYLKIAGQYKGKIPTAVGFDNKWDGSLKQRLACLAAPFYITNKFDACFVPGMEQKTFALKMGFEETQIELGAYCCDFNFFQKQYEQFREEKSNHFPHRFIYVGRYVEHKGIKDLWKAFIELKTEDPNDWELWCIGTGDVAPVVHSDIKHLGFVQPKDLSKYIKETGVFILPSHFEPWGVVVHEFAAAGFPIICSDEVGARTAFVEEGGNGYIYKAGNLDELKRAMKKMVDMEAAGLIKMGEQSVQLARKITPETWSDTLLKLLKK